MDSSENNAGNRTIRLEAPVEKTQRTIRVSAPFPTRIFAKKRDLDELLVSRKLSAYTSTALDTSPELEAGLTALDDEYTILEPFAEGGQATIYVARDRNLERVVAVKSLKKELKNREKIEQSFITEAKVTAQLDHPAIIPIYSLNNDAEDGIHLVMKLVNGKTLREYLRNVVLNYRMKGIRAFDEDAALGKRLEIFLHACDAIAYAHHRNIIHRDLKPENIMLGEYMEVYVMDWGIARKIHLPPDASERKPDISGTPRYFSPEALRGELCDERADIFTLGLILQEIVTLQFAVAGGENDEVMRNIVNGRFAPIQHLFGKKIDPALKATLKRLEEILTPKTGYDEALRAQIERETQRRSEQIENVRRLQSEQSALEHLTFLCPSAEDAAKNPDFAPIRARMLAKIHILRTREAELENLLAKLQERFGTLLKAQVRLAQGEAPSDVARDLYATQSVTETDRLYEAVLADQTPEGR